MYLTRDEERIIAGEFGEGMRKALEILVAIGKIYGAERLIPISSAHISGVSYHNIREGIDFLRELASEAKVSVKTTLNPGGMDIYRWMEMGIDEEFAAKQREVIDIYRDMGINITLTCTPYHVGNLPGKGEHVAWGESSAVAYINSVVGAMTNRESGISALAAAIIGKTPHYGMHIKEERAPKIRVRVNMDLVDPSDYGALGFVLSRKVDDRIPLIEGLKGVDDEALKLLSASMGTYTGLPIYHIKGITPEAADFDAPREVIEIDAHDMKEAYEYLNESFEDVDLVWIGCPHSNLEELRRIAERLKSKTIKTELWVTTSRKVLSEAERRGYIEVIEGSGAKVICDTCVAVAPLKHRFKTLVTNSAKGCYYGRGVNKFLVKVVSLDKCIEVALRGGWV
jgi:hypothetical protein